ncbi:MAG: alpha/beta hydrolase [Anaerolineae bacterium]
MMRYKLLALWIVAFALTACSGAANPGTPAGVGTFEQAPCPIELPDEAPYGVDEGTSLKRPKDIVCGYVTVPEEHAVQNDRTIRLAVAIVKATGDDPAPDPMVIESGGPGGSSVASAPGVFSGQFSDIREKRDIVFIEQRGTTYSEPALLCEEQYRAGIEVLGEDLDAETKEARVLAGLQACRDRLAAEGVNLSAYDTVENAADIPMVMTALGYEQFNLYGVSYGTYLAQHVMRAAPGRLRSVILDGVVPMDPSLRVGVVQGTDHAIRRIFAACAENPTCNARYPDLETVFFDLVAQYDSQPITIEVEVPDIYFPVDVRVTGDQLVSQLYQHIYHTAAIPLIPAQIYALAEGDHAFIDNMEDYVVGNEVFSRGMYYSVRCAESNEYLAPYGTTEGAYPEIARMLAPGAESIKASCDVWDVEPLSDARYTPVTDAIPTLILSGELDPVTPPENGAVVAASLPDAYAYTFPGVGHGSFSKSACSISIVAQFLDDPTHAPDATCIADMELAFVSGLSLEELTLKPMTVPEYGIHALAPEGWHRIDTDYYVAADLTVELVITENREDELDDFLDEWEASDVLSRVESHGRTWELRGIAKHGAAGHLATSPSDDGFYMVLAISTPENKGDLYTTIFKPIVDAFEVRR